jgi:homogentisate 1,2-dioxygenase
LKLKIFQAVVKFLEPFRLYAEREQGVAFQAETEEEARSMLTKMFADQNKEAGEIKSFEITEFQEMPQEASEEVPTNAPVMN